MPRWKVVLGFFIWASRWGLCSHRCKKIRRISIVYWQIMS